MSTITAFQSKHLAMLCKCTGTSFISGSVNHGFINNPTALITTLVGVGLFTTGSIIDTYLSAHGDAPSESMWSILLLSIIMSLGIGAFTGGLQHVPFPSAPVEYWVIPVGFVLTVLGFAWTFSDRWGALIKPISYYALIAAAFVAITSYSIAHYFHWFAEPTATIAPIINQTTETDFLNSWQQTISKAQSVITYSQNEELKKLAKKIIIISNSNSNSNINIK